MDEERLIPGTEALPALAAAGTRGLDSAGAAPRLRRPDRRQTRREPVVLDGLLPAEHAARTIGRVVERLDWSAFEGPIAVRGREPGRAATDPRLLVALTERGLVKVERISQDGKRVRTSAGSSSFHREATLRKRLEAVRTYIEELKRQPDEAPGESARRRAARERGAREKQERLEQALALLPELQVTRSDPKTNRKNRVKPVRVSRTDPPARKMKMADGGIRPAYNVQLASDTHSGAIVGADVVNSPADNRQSGPLREQVEQRTGLKVKEHLMDEGYVSMEQIEAAEKAGVAVYAPLPTGKDDQPVTASRWDTPFTTRWRPRMQTTQAQEIYKQRAPTSARPNAEFQERLGLRSFAVRGLSRVRCVACGRPWRTT